jgi:Uma2 family endonuclease
MITQRKLTVDDVVAMGELGILKPDERVELIDGTLYRMTPPSSKHAAHIDRLSKALEHSYGDRTIVRVQSPVRLSAEALLEPDLALLRPRSDFYEDAYPESADILLVIEVSLSSLPYDREQKLPIYAKANVPEVWIVDLEGKQVEAYREPLGRHYRHRLLVQPGEAVAPAALPDAPELVVL